MGQSQALLKPKQKIQFQYQVTVTAAQATTPKFTFSAGAPAAVVDWGDGTAQSAVTSGTELSHTYTAGGTYTVKLIAPNQSNYLSELDINNDKVVSVFTPIQMFPVLTSFAFYGNSAWNQDISNWSKQNFGYFHVGSCSNLKGSINHLRNGPAGTHFNLAGTLLSGDITALVLPSNLADFSISNTLITGDVGSLAVPASLLFYSLNDTTISGCPDMTSLTSIISITVQNCALSQATVDLYLSRCVAVEAQTTYATPTLNLGGSDAAPNAQGYTDKATLAAAGWTVTTN